MLEVDASNLPSGPYLYRFIVRTAAETTARVGQMTLLK
jgi:hypothetical protein